MPYAKNCNKVITFHETKNVPPIASKILTVGDPVAYGILGDDIQGNDFLNVTHGYKCEAFRA